MNRQIEPIRIHAVLLEQQTRLSDPRESFWASIRETKSFSNYRPTQFEAKLRREFGPSLRTALVEEISSEIRKFGGFEFRDSPGAFFEEFYHYARHLKEPSPPDYQAFEAFNRYLEYRQQLLRDNPALRSALQRAAAAASVIFSTRIAGYSSLDFELSTGSFNQLATAFDKNFETFRVFLEAFVPQAFANVFYDEFADALSFTIYIPKSFQDAFEKAPDAESTSPRSERRAEPYSPAPTAARERAEWIWRLANGSLIIPLLLALVVFFYGLKLLTELQSMQNQMMQPILQHQLELLREDRLRMTSPSIPATSDTAKTR